MKWLTFSWKIGYVRGVEIRVHFSMLFSLVAAYFVFYPVTLLRGLFVLLWLIGFILSIFLHELAHALVAGRVGVGAKSIIIWLLGGFTVLNREPEKPLHRLAIYVAGSLMTALLVLIFSITYFSAANNPPSFLSYIYAWLCLALAVTNLILFIFSVLPVYPLDGGKILHAVSELFFGRANANLITMIVSVPILLGLIVFGIYTRDYILLFLCVFIALAIGTLNPHTHRWINLGFNYLFKRGAYYLLQQDYERAAHYFTLYIEREPQQVNHYIARSLCYLWMLQKEKALADIERALEIAPDNEVLLVLRGDLYALDKDYDSALDLFLRAQNLNPNWAPSYIDRGSVLLDKKEFQPALEELSKGIALPPQIPLSYVIRSKAYFRLGNLEAAHQDQNLAVKLSEKDALTRADFSMDDYEGYLDWVEDYYGRVLSKRPRSWYAYQGRADAYRVNGEHDKAIADYTRALEINPREPRLYLGRGKSHQAKGSMDRAQEDFRRVHAVTNKVHYRRQAEELLEHLNGE